MTAAPMIEVLVFNAGAVVASAEAATPEDAVYAGQVLHDESLPIGVQTVGSLEVGFYVDGRLSRMVEGRP